MAQVIVANLFHNILIASSKQTENINKGIPLKVELIEEREKGEKLTNISSKK